MGLSLPRKITIVCAFLFCFCKINAQTTDSLDFQQWSIPFDWIESFLQDTDSEGTFDFNTFFDQLELYAQNPINLNKATEEELHDLGLLSDVQIINFLNYRDQAGDLISIYELQAIQGFDLQTIRRILPFISLDAKSQQYQKSLVAMLTEGQNELYIRWSRFLEQQKGFRSDASSPYLGDPNQLYIRYKHGYSNKLSYGITAEKDRGEEFFKGSNPNGFDFYSAHFFLRDYNPWLKELAIGDFSLNMGQGLLAFTGFSRGKGAQVTSIKRSGPTLKAYTSVNEVNFMRGLGTTLKLGNIEFTAFYSIRGIDGNVIAQDTADLDEDLRFISSLDRSGLHRTATEIAKKNSTQLQSMGGVIKYKARNGHIAVNAIYNQLDGDLSRPLAPYANFRFTGSQLFGVSTDYSYIYKNINFFGETAYSENGALATLNGLLVGLDQKVDLSLFYRYYPRDYQSFFAAPLGESRTGVNETGIYMGLEIRPHPNWRLAGYVDMWENPWLRFNVDAPSQGHEYRVRLTYFKKRKFEAYVELRDEIKPINLPDNETKLNQVIPNRTFQTRIHFGNKVSKALELRTRLDVGFADNQINAYQRGFVLYQDVIYRPVGFPLSFTTRFAIFDTDSFSARYYSFENNLIYAFSVPAYYNRGTRFYFNVRYKGIRNLTVEARYDQTFWANEDSFGSGGEEIDGQTRSRVSAQLIYRF